MTKPLDPQPGGDGIDRRGFLECMAWAGTGLLCTVSGGILSSAALAAPLSAGAGHPIRPAPHALQFVQLSDSHIGFNKAANPDVTATLQIAVDKINALPEPPAFILHTGDLTQLSKPDQFDTVNQVLRGAKTTTGQVFYVPGEHDVLDDNGQQFLARYGHGTQGDGWQSFDHSGVHFIGLVNVLNLHAGGMGSLGQAQLDWLAQDVRGLSASTPIVVFAHVPLWSIYPPWGWGTDDAAQALSALKRFGSVTVLNGHIHQTMQKVEGNVHFHTAMSTAFPQPAPGTAPAPGPMRVPPGQLQHVLGITQVEAIPGRHPLALVDSPLQAAVSTTRLPAASPAASVPGKAAQVTITNFSFTPPTLTVSVGTQVTWLNNDDVPHTVVSVNALFKSRALDTGDTFSYTFPSKGDYAYFCSIHPMMTAKVIVR